MAYITADQERSYARKAATEALTQVAHRIEGEISREMQVAETLASSAALDHGNLSDFYREATRIVAARPLWETAALTKPDQEQVLNVLRPLGAPLGPVTDSRKLQRRPAHAKAGPRRTWVRTRPRSANSWCPCVSRSLGTVNSATS